MTTIDRFLSPLTLLSALGCGLMAGVFFAFSSFVMNALARLAPAQGILAMQSINLTVINGLFMGVFLGSGMACTLLAFSSLTRWHHAGSLFLLVGSLLYLLGTVLVTTGVNVPLNDALAAVKPDSAEGALRWASYLATWTLWNHVRSVAALAAAASFILAFCARKTP